MAVGQEAKGNGRRRWVSNQYSWVNLLPTAITELPVFIVQLSSVLQNCKQR